MFYLDERITNSVTTAVMLLNDSRHRFDWQDQTPGVPVYVFSKSKNLWFNCTTSVDGIYYSQKACMKADPPVADTPILRFLSRVADSKAPMGASRKQRADAVIAWADEHLNLSQDFEVSNWRRSDDANQIHVIGESMFEPAFPDSDEPSLPDLTSDIFMEKLARVGITKDLITEQYHSTSPYFVLTAKGIDYVFEKFNLGGSN